MTEKNLVLRDHYGAVDDLLSQLLLLTMEDKEIVGINVTPADCFIHPATDVNKDIFCTYILTQFRKDQSAA